MDKQGIAELNILEEIQVDGQCSQRELARRSGLGLTYLNVYLKGLVRKGYVSVRDMSGRRLWYNLTPAGITEKARMTLEYMKWSLAKYRDIRERHSRKGERCLSGIEAGKPVRSRYMWCFGCR